MEQANAVVEPSESAGRAEVEPRASRQCRLVELLLLGLAAEVEVGKDAPFVQWLNLLLDGKRRLFADVQELIALARGVAEDHHEESRGLPAPIVSKRGNDTDHVRGEASGYSIHRRAKSILLGERFWNMHGFIIAPSGRGGESSAM